MPEFSMKLEGAEELLRKLRKLELKTGKKVLNKGLRAGAKIVQVATKARAPVDTGRLRRSIVVRASLGKGYRKKRGLLAFYVFPSTKKEPGLRGSYKKARAVATSKSRMGKKAAQDWYYPSVIEYGTSTRTAKPFMRPAWDASKEVAAKTVMRVALDALEVEARK